MKKIKFNYLFILLAVVLSSCLDDQYNDIIKNAKGFDYKTTREIKLSVRALDMTDQPMKGVFMEIFSRKPISESGNLLPDAQDYLLFKGVTAASGNLDCTLAPATTVDTLFVLVNQIGLPGYYELAVDSAELNLVIGGAQTQILSEAGPYKIVSVPEPTYVQGFLALGKWTTAGVPKYLWSPNDVIEQELLQDINASLPERSGLTVSHPEYFQSEDDGSIELVEDAEVWVTFVHEGAGYLNTLAYYTHPTNNPPATSEEIADKTIIFPNVSFQGSGGGLVSGNKVQLMYYDKATKKFSNVFPAGVTVAWVFRAQGWQTKGSTIQDGTTFYSDKRFNPEVNEVNRKHNVVLHDSGRKLYLIGFEDIHRENYSDNDFNDAVFYVTSNPYTAINKEIYRPIDTPKDADGDGVGDSLDEYPNDSEKAFNNYYPGKNKVGTMAFEDLWPNKGDYDFNDLIVDYNFNQITNASNEVVSMEAAITVRAIGASYKNGFGIELNQLPENIKSVNGMAITENFVNLNANGTEKDQKKAVVIAFDNSYSVLKNIGGSGVNTIQGNPYQKPVTLHLDVDLINPVAYSDFGTPPYNPFMIINGERGKEVHLPASAPTSLADLSLLGTGDDDSNPETDKYYMSDKYLPWAINIPQLFDYPAEKQDITKTYLKFNSWASSRGYNYMDWYEDKAGYRDVLKIFTVK